VLKYRIPIIILTLLLVGVSAAGMGRIWFSTDYRYFFSRENPQMKAFEELQDKYTKSDNVIFALAPKDGDVFTPETLAAVAELTKASWQIPYSLRVDSITNFQHTRAFEDDLVVEDLVRNPRGLGKEELARIKKTALAEPLILNRLLSGRAHVTAVNVTINLPGESVNEVPEVVAFSRKTAEELRARYPDLNVYISGMIFFNNAFMEASQDDMGSVVPAMFLVIVVVMGLLLRSLFGTLATVAVIIFSALTAMGIMGWANIPLTPASMSAPTIILTLAVADSIHILVSFFHAMDEGMNRRDAVVESLRLNLAPVFLTSVTTAIGFLSMNFSDSPPFRDMGNIVAVGVMAALIYSVFFLPALISILPIRARKKRDGKKPAMECYGDFIVRNRRFFFWGMLVFMVALTVGVTRIEFNDTFIEYMSTRYRFRQDSDFITENLSGIYSIEYSLEAGEDNGISNPEYLEKIEEFATWYRAEPGVEHVTVLTDILKRLNKNMHGDDPSYYRIPERKDLAAQYLLLYEMSLPYGLDLNNQINVSKSATRFSVTVENMDTKDFLALEASASAWLKENAPESMFSYGASPTIMFSYISKRNIKGMLTGTAIALVLISAILIFALKSLKLGLLSLIPNLSPALMAFGLWGYLITQVGLGLSIVTAMSLGIVVDDTIHFLSKYLRARRELDMNALEAVCYSFKTVGKALLVTSLILVAGFVVLSFSGFRMNSDMATLTAIALVFALMADFLFLPPLLIAIDKDKKGERQ
jgi:predicted RND superfamily exporter protein